MNTYFLHVDKTSWTHSTLSLTWIRPNTRIRIQNHCFNDHISLYIVSNSITIWVTTSWTHSLRHNKWTEYDEQIVYNH